MVQLRSLMPSVSKEVKISMTELDAIQRTCACASAHWRFSAIPARMPVTRTPWRICNQR
jgi:hypothetical protein